MAGNHSWCYVQQSEDSNRGWLHCLASVPDKKLGRKGVFRQGSNCQHPGTAACDWVAMDTGLTVTMYFTLKHLTITHVFQVSRKLLFSLHIGMSASVNPGFISWWFVKIAHSLSSRLFVLPPYLQVHWTHFSCIHYYNVYFCFDTANKPVANLTSVCLCVLRIDW